MKKVILTIATLLAFNVGTGFAAPVNDLSKGETALGIGTDNFYVENRLANNFTLGMQSIDWNHVGNMKDVYGQLQFSNNVSGVIGTRNVNSGSTSYLGMAVTAPLAPEWNGYASLIAGSQFKEVQVGANYKLARNVDFNVNYHSYMPELGSDKNGTGFGATFKF